MVFKDYIYLRKTLLVWGVYNVNQFSNELNYIFNSPLFRYKIHYTKAVDRFQFHIILESFIYSFRITSSVLQFCPPYLFLNTQVHLSPNIVLHGRFLSSVVERIWFICQSEKSLTTSQKCTSLLFEKHFVPVRHNFIQSIQDKRLILHTLLFQSFQTFCLTR